MKKTLIFAVTAQAISIAVLLGLAIEFFSQISQLNEYSAKVEHTYKVINQIARLQSSLKDAETSSRGYLLTGEKQFLVPLSRSSGVVLPNIDTLRKLSRDNNSQMMILKRIDTLAFEKIALVLENTRLLHRISTDSINKRLNIGTFLMDSIDYYLGRMRATEFNLLGERTKLKTIYEEALPRYMQWVFLIAGLLTMVFGAWIFVELRKRFRYQSMLQVKVNELRQSNEELEQIAFAASHDLQEPLRKIRIFSDRLLLKSNGRPEEEVMMLQRMNLAAARLQDLISDLVTFNQLVQNTFDYQKISLQQVIKQAVSTLRSRCPEIVVTLQGDEHYPHLRASPPQIEILFQQIFNNVLQFRSPDRPPALNISGENVKWSDISGLPSEITEGHFFRLTIADNGIGFDESFKDRMFRPFQRLHNIDNETNTRRKGMGLAMCKRVMINLGGWIDAAGIVGEGATIYLYFPVNAV
jgi:signal transduction histidine kinase